MLGYTPNGMPATNLYMTMLDCVGVRPESIGGRPGKIEQLAENRPVFESDEIVRKGFEIETMKEMIIQIPDDLARGLDEVAAAEKKSVEELAVECLRNLIEKPTSPEAVLRLIRGLPHPSPAAVDDLDAAIAASRLPVSDQGMFDI